MTPAVEARASVPEFILQDHPNAFALIVKDDALARAGFQVGDCCW